MTQRTRYFLVGSGLVVAVGLCTGLVAFYSGELSARRQPLDEFAYVPASVTAVAYADVRHIMNSGFHQRLRALMPAGPERDRLLAETGIDLERDIDTVVAGLSPSDSAGGPVVLVRGRFNDRQIENVAVQHGATIEDVGGKRVLTFRHPGAADQPGGEQPALAFLEPGLVALGQVDAIRYAIDQAAARQTVAASPDLMRAVQQVLGDGDAWLVGRLDTLPDQAKLPGAVREHLAGVQWFSMSAAIDQAMSCKVRAEAKDDEAGEALRGVVNGALAVAKIMAGHDTRLDTVLDSMQARGTGPALELSFTVPAEALDALRSSAAASKSRFELAR